MNKAFFVFMVIGLLFSMQQTTYAQHTDVQFSYVDNQIQVIPEAGGDDLVFESEFPTFGIEAQFASLPGFISEPENGLGINPGDEIFYNVLSDLLYWDGTSITTPPEGFQLRVVNTPSFLPDTIIDESSGEQLGGGPSSLNRVGNADGGGFIHNDLQWTLEPTPAPFESTAPEVFGVYGVKLQLSTSAEGVADSNPFIFAFNLGLNSTEAQLGADAFGQLLVSPPGIDGDFDGDGDVDGEDFLVWQRGSPNADDLNDFLLNYGTASQSAQQFATAVPEPTAVLLSLLGITLLLGSHPRRLAR